MDLERMLDKCLEGQWKVDDLDWSVEPKPMSEAKERAVVQYFTDMVGIERVAGALFKEQLRRADDPTLARIFETFMADEERHAECAARLARHYDVHHYQSYTMNPDLVRLVPAFVHALRHFSTEVCTIYVTAGELILDVALLRSLDDYVDDAMSRQVMARVNRDESRHLAIDYFMVERFASPDYQRAQKGVAPKALRERALSAYHFAQVLRHLRPFIQSVLVAPMTLTDPSGRRIKEAWKRMQLLLRRPDVARRPLPRVVHAAQAMGSAKGVGPVLSKGFARVAGLPDGMLQRLNSKDEEHRAARLTVDQLAEEALAAKQLH